MFQALFREIYVHYLTLPSQKPYETDTLPTL